MVWKAKMEEFVEQPYQALKQRMVSRMVAPLAGFGADTLRS